jgi:hypothetical protein
MMDGPHDPEAAMRAAGATVEAFSPRPAPRGRAFGRLRVLTIADAASAPPRHYLLHGLVAAGELSMWWGAPKCGKSFLLLRLAYGLALARSMWGRKAKPCRVLYVAAEGEGGFAGRLLALRDALGDAGEAFRFIAQPATIGPPSSDLADAIAAALAMHADLVVLDTLARTFGEGDENAAKDMSGFIAALDRIRAETGAHVAVIHHGTKEGGSSRGSGALVAAADLVVKVSKGAEGEPSIAKVENAKDDADGAELPFRLRLVDMTPAPDGEARRTCVAEDVEPAEPRSAAKAAPKLADGHALLLRSIASLTADNAGELVKPEPGMPTVRAIPRAELRARLIRDGWFPEPELLPQPLPSGGVLSTAGYRRENKALEALKRKGLAGFSRNAVWLA